MANQTDKEPASSKSAGSQTKQKTGARASRRSTRAAAKPEDAIKLLKSDHNEVKGWFDDFEKTDDEAKKEKLARDICRALTVHTQIEEEIFYPAAREVEVDEDLLDEANVEHASAKQLIAQIESMGPSDPMFDATVTVLGEYVKHHIEEEEGELFPECKDSAMNLKALGQELANRKAELMKTSKAA
ncbi:MAG: hemerythrin domain-containing protein [Defluviicoccus sp.]